jgi:hypothetical protein
MHAQCPTPFQLHLGSKMVKEGNKVGVVGRAIKQRNSNIIVPAIGNACCRLASMHKNMQGWCNLTAMSIGANSMNYVE